MRGGWRGCAKRPRPGVFAMIGAPDGGPAPVTPSTPVLAPVLVGCPVPLRLRFSRTPPSWATANTRPFARCRRALEPRETVAAPEFLHHLAVEPRAARRCSPSTRPDARHADRPEAWTRCTALFRPAVGSCVRWASRSPSIDGDHPELARMFRNCEYVTSGGTPP